MSLRPTQPLFLGMGLRQPQYKPAPLFPRSPTPAHYPEYHPYRSQYPHPNVHFRPRNKQPDHTTPDSHGPPTHFRITLHRSALGLPESYMKTLQVLGLRKKDSTVFHPIRADNAGLILKVKELVQVRNVSWWQMEDEMKLGKGQARGTTISENERRLKRSARKPSSWLGNTFTL